MKLIEKIKQIYNNGNLLPIYEMFYTIQGEGFNSGKPVFLIRIAGCNIGCPWCDTKYAWKPSPNQLIEVERLINIASSYNAKSILITGGEPTLYNLEPLTAAAKTKNITTYLETSGTNLITGNWDWICLSPKPFKQPIDQAFEIANELKVIIYSENDFKFAEEMRKRLNSRKIPLYLQPEWSNREKIVPLIIDYIKENPQWRLSLQIHKILSIP